MTSSGDFFETSLTKSWDQAARKVKPYHQAPSTRIYFDQENLPIENLLTLLDMVLGNIGKKKISVKIHSSAVSRKG